MSENNNEEELSIFLAKNLDTYVNNICLKSMFCTYKGTRIIVCDSAMQELMKESKTLFDVKEIPDGGGFAPRKRKKHTVEKWLDKGNKTYNAVLVRDYNEIKKEECRVLIHFGKFSRRK